MKIQLYRPFDIKAAAKSERAIGIEITYGKRCTECWCKDRFDCKLRRRFTWHNFCVDMKRKFNIRIPIYFSHELEENFSGTVLCPKKKERIFTCWDRIYSCGDRECSCKERVEAIKNGTYNYSSGNKDGTTCKYFIASDYGDDYSRETGKRLYGGYVEE